MEDLRLELEKAVEAKDYRKIRELYKKLVNEVIMTIDGLNRIEKEFYDILDKEAFFSLMFYKPTPPHGHGY